MSSAETPRMLTAAELDALTPSEGAAALRARIVTDLSALPIDFRAGIEQTVRDLRTETSEAS